MNHNREDSKTGGATSGASPLDGADTLLCPRHNIASVCHYGPRVKYSNRARSPPICDSAAMAVNVGIVNGFVFVTALRWRPTKGNANGYLPFQFEEGAELHHIDNLIFFWQRLPHR